MILTHEYDVTKAAIRYAEYYGFRVLPVQFRGKSPMLKDWVKNASKDPAAVAKMFTCHTGNLGLACGVESGLLVIDVDLPDGQSTMEKLQEELGALPPTLAQRTGSGGRQLLFKYPRGKNIRNSAGESGNGLGKNVDVRGEGGMIVCPPSIHPNGNRYVWETDLPLAYLPPAWVVRLERSQPKTPKVSEAAQKLHPYVDTAMNNELFQVRVASLGTRNTTLNKAAFSLGQWVSGGLLGYEQAHGMLLDAAAVCGVLHDDGETQTKKTIAGALEKGARCPRDIPSISTSTPQQGGQLLKAMEPPILFSDRPVAAIDTSQLPTLLRGIVDHCAQALQVPPELPLFNTLAAMSVVAQGKARIVINSGYVEPLSLYLLVALPPGERKSPVVELCKRPLLEWEREQALLVQKTQKARESERRSYEKLIESKRSRLGTIREGKSLQQAMQEIAELESNLPELPIAPRLFADDVTPEALAVLLQKHGERMGIIEPEGGLFEILGGRYSNSIPNLDLFLKGWSGETVVVDRRREASIYLNSPMLTLCISPQPDVVQSLAEKPGFKGRGLLARFLYALPQSKIGYRKTDAPPVPEKVKEDYAVLLRRVLEAEIPIGKTGRAVPFDIPLSAEAKTIRQHFAERIEVAMREGAALEYMRDWAAKLPGQTVRLAGVLHFFTHSTDAFHQPISGETMHTAVTLSDSLTEHAKAAFSLMGADDNMACAKRILSWALRECTATSPIFTGRECFQGLRGSYPRMASINAGLSVLEERFYIFSIPPEPGKVGRNSQRYRINPTLFSESL